MCQKCYTKKVNLEAKLANLVAEIIAHNKTVSEKHTINAIVILQDFGGDITMLSTMPKIETMMAFQILNGDLHGKN